VLAFTLAEPAVVGIYYALQNVDTGDFDLSLEPADGQRIVPMGANRLRTDRNGGGLWEEALPAGTYRLLLSAAQSQGTLSWSRLLERPRVGLGRSFTRPPGERDVAEAVVPVALEVKALSLPDSLRRRRCRTTNAAGGGPCYAPSPC